VRIAYTADQERLRDELRAYYAELLTPEVVAELADSRSVGPAPRRIWKQMCADGWAGIGWPEEWGGQGRSAVEQFIFYDESMRAGAPVPMLTINTVGPAIMHAGTDGQKSFFLPKILAGDVHFCIGYSEPGSGTDLASLTTRAVRDGDDYVINGQKMWTSVASTADFIWLAVRTDPEAANHKGISLFAVDMGTPGISVQPLHLIADHDLNATFFDDVRVPASCLVGEENNAWRIITSQLNNERVTVCSSGIIERVFDEVLTWSREQHLADGRRVIDQEWVQISLARIQAKLEYLRLLNWKVAWTGTQGPVDTVSASALKVFGTEFYLEAFRLCSEIIGQTSYLQAKSPMSPLHGRLDHLERGLLALTFAGGANEIQRDLIAMFGLGFPRSR